MTKTRPTMTATTECLGVDFAGCTCRLCHAPILAGDQITAGLGGHDPRHVACEPRATDHEDRKDRLMIVKIFPNRGQHQPGKLADAELHFEDGPLAGLKLVGFGIWGRNVTFPTRQYSVDRVPRSFALLRPIMDTDGQARIRDLILEAYDEQATEARMDAADAAHAT